jgi:hypothetical protein
VNPDDIDAASYRSAMDQLAMYSRDLAAELASFYTQLRAGGIPDDLAGQLTVNLQLYRYNWGPSE